MKIKIPKPYWIIGSLASASIITVTGYNMIVATANNKEVVTTSNPTSQIEQVDYSNDIDELKQRLSNAETKITGLEEQVAVLENNSGEKDKTISNLQSKINKLQSSINSFSNQNKELSDKLATLRSEMDKLLSFIDVGDEVKAGEIRINVKSATKMTDKEYVHVRINVENETIYAGTVKSSERLLTKQFSGKGIVSVKVYIDDVLIKTSQLDLSQDTILTVE